MQYIKRTLFFTILIAQAATMVTHTAQIKQEATKQEGQESGFEKAKKIGRIVGIFALSTIGVITLCASAASHGIYWLYKARLDAKIIQKQNNEMERVTNFRFDNNHRTKLLLCNEAYVDKLKGVINLAPFETTMKQILLDDLVKVLQGDPNAYNEFLQYYTEYLSFHNFYYYAIDKYFEPIKDIFDMAKNRNECIDQVKKFNDTLEFNTVSVRFPEYPAKGTIQADFKVTYQ